MIALTKVYAAKDLMSVAPKTMQDEAQQGINEWNLDDPEAKADFWGGSGSFNGPDFAISSKYNAVKELRKDNEPSLLPADLALSTSFFL